MLIEVDGYKLYVTRITRELCDACGISFPVEDLIECENIIDGNYTGEVETCDVKVCSDCIKNGVPQ